MIKILLVTLLGLIQCSPYSDRYNEALRIAEAMTLDQKIGQTLQADIFCFTGKKGTDPTEAVKLYLGSVLVGGDGVPDSNGNLVITDEMDEVKIRDVYAQGTLDKWQTLSKKFNFSYRVTTNNNRSYDIRMLLGTDAVHGNQHIAGAILFPHNSGLACSHNPDVFNKAGFWTAKGVKDSGFNYAFSPTVAVSHNPQWGRFYETIGSQTDFASSYANSFVKGMQGDSPMKGSVAACSKHFFGDGATHFGADQGNAEVTSFASFIEYNTAGHRGAIAANLASSMVTYSAVNWVRNSASSYVWAVLRGELEFTGFTISDYDEVGKSMKQQLPTSFALIDNRTSAVSTLINAGIDMLMLPKWGNIQEIITVFKDAVTNQTITTTRLNDAVARILAVKLVFGIAEEVTPTKERLEQRVTVSPWGTTEYEDSLQAVHESAVLLKNEKVIPVNLGSLQYIVLVGERIVNFNNLAKYELFRNFDDIGMQCGGWSLRWQGFEGNTLWSGENKKTSNASSILDALLAVKGTFKLVYPNYTTMTEQIRIEEERTQFLESLKTLRKNMTAKNTLILGVVGEPPFSEFLGDVGVPYCINQTILGGEGCLFDGGGNPYLPPNERETLTLNYGKFDDEVISSVRSQSKDIPLLTVSLAGRPFVMPEIINSSSALLASFLPGTSGGQGILDIITGSYRLRQDGDSDQRNTLAFDWPKTVESLKDFPIYKADGLFPRIPDPQFKMGYGLSTANS